MANMILGQTMRFGRKDCTGCIFIRYNIFADRSIDMSKYYSIIYWSMKIRLTRAMANRGWMAIGDGPENLSYHLSFYSKMINVE